MSAVAGVAARGESEQRPYRHADRHDRVLIAAALVGVGWLALFSVLTATAQRSAALGTFVGNVVYLVPVVAATVLSGVAAARTRGRVRRAWRLLVVSNVLWLAGELTWAGYAYLSADGAPTPSVADVGYLLSYLIALPAVLIGFGVRGVLGGARGLLDAVLVGASVGAIGWQLVIGPMVPGSWNAGTLTSFLYPLISVSIVSVLVAVLLSGRASAPRSMLVAGLAFGVAAVADAGYTYMFVRDSYTDSSWLNLGWQAEAVLLSLAALIAIRRSEGDEQQPQLDRDLAILPALVAVLAVSGLAIGEMIRLGQLSNLTLTVTVVLFLGLLLRQFIATRDRTQLARQLQIAADTDTLTGLYNRRFFEETMRVEAGQAAHHGTPLSLVLIDLDRFKRINDKYGHSAGDAVLVQAADRLRRSLRANDLIARLGGEEFVCLLRDTGEEAAVEVAEQARLALCHTPVSIPGRADRLVLTASLGVASVEPRDFDAVTDAERLINAADRATYRAKARGRNRVVGSCRLNSVELDPEIDIPTELVWLADQIDGMLGDREHSTAVARWSLVLGDRLGLNQAAQRRLAGAARLHDIGKLGIPRCLLTKPGPLTDAEWVAIRRHPEEGARMMVELSNRPDLAPLVAAHHERHDGRGYPRGLAGQRIPIEARIIAICDAWATMLTNRPYAPALTRTVALTEIRRERGRQFDPAVADAFLRLIDEGVIDEPTPWRAGTRPPHAGPTWLTIDRNEGAPTAARYPRTRQITQEAQPGSLPPT